jgi:hypothetical protein
MQLHRYHTGYANRQVELKTERVVRPERSREQSAARVCGYHYYTTIKQSGCADEQGTIGSGPAPEMDTLVNHG